MTQDKPAAIARFLIFSLFGVVAFFVPLSMDGKTTIVIDHVVSSIQSRFLPMVWIYTCVLIVVGIAEPFISGRWKYSIASALMAVLQIAALPLAAMYFLGRGPEAIMQAAMLPFLFDKLAVPVGLIIPVGAVLLTFLTGFGLLEAMGRLMQPVMQPLWKTPGRSAIDAIASFAGSYSVGLILTRRVYQAGRYSAKEAAIIATGFSTVSASFMVVVAKTLDLTGSWNAYFWTTLLVTFSVTAITVRLPPLAAMNNRRAVEDDIAKPGGDGTRSLWLNAWKDGVAVAAQAEPLFPLLWENLLDGLRMATRVVPSILSVGMLGLLLARYTPIFDLLGYLLYPFVWISQLDNPDLVATALASGLAEMFLPAIQSTGMELHARFTVAVVSVSSILFFSASIPCVLATEIPISIGQMVIVWFQRTALSIPLAAAMAYLFLPS